VDLAQLAVVLLEDLAEFGDCLEVQYAAGRVMVRQGLYVVEAHRLQKKAVVVLEASQIAS
jgi:hypothetical protein